MVVAKTMPVFWVFYNVYDGLYWFFEGMWCLCLQGDLILFKQMIEWQGGRKCVCKIEGIVARHSYGRVSIDLNESHPKDAYSRFLMSEQTNGAWANNQK